MASLSSLASSVLTQVSQKKTDAYLIELNEQGGPLYEVSANGPITSHLAFQYFPDSITDSKGINYQQKEIPGASLPLYQWVSGGERLISFTAQFTTDVDLISVGGATGTAALLGTGQGIEDRLKSAGASRRNVDIRAALAWLRRYMYPTYNNGASNAVAGGGTTITQAPKKLRLVLPSSGIGHAGASANISDSVRVIMTQCDITYDAFFPSGLPRIATVALAFAEIAQFGGFVEFPQRGDYMDSAVSGEAIGGEKFTFGYKVHPK